MPSLRSIAFVLFAALTLVSCRRDPNVAKKEYLESGDKYFAKGRFKEARIQYENSKKADQKFGPARYKLAETYLRLKPANVGGAISEYRRAIELLEGNQAYQQEYYLSMVHLSEILLFGGRGEKQLMDEVQKYCTNIFKRDANSFDGLRLTGLYNYVLALKAKEASKTDEVNSYYAAALENYRKADAVKPGDNSVALQIAVVLRDTGHAAESEPYFRRVIDKDKGDKDKEQESAGVFWELYRTYMIEEKRDQAEALLKEGAKAYPKNAFFLERLAYHYGALGRRDDMANVLQQIKSHAKDWDSVYKLVGDFYLRIGDAESALREYREGQNSDSKNKSMYQHSIVEVLLRQGKRAEAAEVNKQILKANPKDADAESLQATFLLDSGDVRTALTQLQAVVTSSPDNASAHYQLGRALLASGQPNASESARAHFQKAIDLRPDMILPRLGLAELLVSRGEFDAALISVNDILSKDPNNMNARLIQSQALLGQKKYGESDNLLGAMAKANPTSPDIWYQMGLSNMAQGKLKEAEAAFQHSYELNPNNPRGLLGMVDAKSRGGKPNEAMALLQTESKKFPNRPDLLFLMGITARNQGNFDDSVGYFRKLMDGVDKKANVRADLYLQIADSLRRKGDRDAAIQNLMEARKILPENETVLSALGLVLDQAGRRTDAKQAYEACLKVNPNNVLVLNNLAYLMAEINTELDVALNYVQKAKALAPNSAEIGDTYGWILLKKGLAVNAIPVFQDVVNRVPSASTFRYHLAMAYSQKGDTVKAKAEAQEALKLSPTSTEQQQLQQMISKLR